jgi:SAM-dependent MidA family methyltransferase
MTARRVLVLLFACAALSCAQVRHPREHQLALARRADPAAVRGRLLSFRDYLDIVLFHPSVGYYSTGRVDLRRDFRTFPVALAPSFGQMVAEQVFRMWEGMRRAGTLGALEPFTVAELGGGDGAMAESFLDHVEERATVEPRWRRFEEQLVYVSLDRSPALSERQRARNARFGRRFEARQADATELGAAIPKASLAGVILSNELLDCFSVYKIVWDGAGASRVAFTVPSVARTEWARLAGVAAPGVRDLVERGDDAIRRGLLEGAEPDRVYVDRAAFPSLLEVLNGLGDYEERVSRLRVEEVYAPSSVVPEVAEHVRRYAREYAHQGRGAVAYVNLGAERFVHDAAAALRAGYVFTIDYGSGWRGTLAGDEHLRIYGRGVPEGKVDPYDGPTLHDITTDVNFGHVAAEGRLLGLEPVYFGPQRSMRTGTSVRLDEPSTTGDAEDFRMWAGLFETWDVYKTLVQQKRGTDPAYAYPDTHAEPLD